MNHMKTRPHPCSGLSVPMRRNSILMRELESQTGTWGVAAQRTSKMDELAAAAAGQAVELYGIWVGPPNQKGSRYFRRRQALRGTALSANSYPALQLPRSRRV